MSRLIVTGFGNVAADRWDEWLERMDELRSLTPVGEDGCHVYRFYVESNDAPRFFVYEEWESEEALEHHRAILREHAAQQSPDARGRGLTQDVVVTTWKEAPT